VCCRTGNSSHEINHCGKILWRLTQGLCSKSNQVRGKKKNGQPRRLSYLEEYVGVSTGVSIDYIRESWGSSVCYTITNMCVIVYHVISFTRHVLLTKSLRRRYCDGTRKYIRVVHSIKNVFLCTNHYLNPLSVWKYSSARWGSNE